MARSVKRAERSVQDFRQTAFTSSVNLVINVSKKTSDPNSYAAHPALLAKTSGYLRKFLFPDALPSAIHVPHWRIGTLQTYLRWVYTEHVLYDDLLLANYFAANGFQAPAFRNAIMDTLVASVRRDPSLFPKGGQLCPGGKDCLSPGIRRLMIDLLIWELDHTQREEKLKLCALEFQRDVWKECSIQKAAPGACAPYLEGLDSYYVEVGDYAPLFGTTRYEVDPRLEKLQFDQMVTCIIGSEKKNFYVHTGPLYACSERFKPAAFGHRVIELPSSDPSTFQTFLEWLYFQVVPSEKHGFYHLFDCYRLAEENEVADFGDALMRSIIALFRERMPLLDEVSSAYETTKEGSPLRKLLIDLFAWDSYRYTGSDDDIFPEDFADSVMQICDATNASDRRKYRARPWIATPELYMSQKGWNRHALAGCTSPYDQLACLDTSYAISSVTPRLLIPTKSSVRSAVSIDSKPPAQTLPSTSQKSSALLAPGPSKPVATRTLFIRRVPCLEIGKFFGSSAKDIAACYWLEQKKSSDSYAVKFYDDTKAKAAFDALPAENTQREKWKQKQRATRPFVQWANVDWNPEKFKKMTLKDQVRT